MSKRHLKSLATPRTWQIKRKGQKYTIRPKPGSQKKEYCMPITTLLKTDLDFLKTKKESRKMLKTKEVLVDGRRRTSYRYPLGLMDVLTLKDEKKNYRVLLTEKGKIKAYEIDEKESKLKLCKIKDKKTIKKGKTQVITEDGRTILTDDKNLKRSDTILITLPEQTIKEIVKIEKSSTAYIIGGKHIGKTGVIEEVNENQVSIKTKEGVVKTVKKFIFATGKQKPLIKLNG